MRLTTEKLKGLILEVLNEERKIKELEEARMEDLTDVCFVAGSTHSLATACHFIYWFLYIRSGKSFLLIGCISFLKPLFHLTNIYLQ